MKSVLVVFDCDVDEQWLAAQRYKLAVDARVSDEEALAGFFERMVKVAAQNMAGAAITFPYGGNFRVIAIRGVTQL